MTPRPHPLSLEGGLWAVSKPTHAPATPWPLFTIRGRTVRSPSRETAERFVAQLEANDARRAMRAEG